jgi:DNA-binding transcriptional ArsR family regulator
MVVQQLNNKNRLVEVFKALADQTRLKIFSMLRSGCGESCGGDGGCDPKSDEAQRTMGDLAQVLGVGIPTVSHHLKVLRQAGLIIHERHGRNVHCRINDLLLKEVSLFFNDES